MNIELKAYQDRAVDELTTSVKHLLDRPGDGEVCVFQAPTGSGKTIMTTKFIESIIRELPEEDLCFVWMSIGKGDLHLQSKHSLERIFDGSPRVSLVEEEFNGGRRRIVRNEVVVANWEKLRSKDKEGEWKNLLMKDGENLSFRDVLSKTREQRRIIMIIDESHIGSTAARTNELRDEIAADVVIEMSATPRLKPSADEIIDKSAGYVKVNSKDVIEEGMIKKELIINEGIGKIIESETDSQEIVLEAAYRKRLELKDAFVPMGSSVNPLVLIQIPTAEAGEEKIAAVKKFLSGKGVTEKNRKLAIWLSEQKSDTIDWISESDNEIEFLIFKQAIDTGWDCPRAHILVKFRESKSAIFEIQTVGRILRMPEQKHYDDESLNTGYIYTNVQSIMVKKEEYNPNIIKHLKANRIPSYQPIKLVSYYKARVDYGDVTSSFTAVFSRVANEHFGIDGSRMLPQQCVELVEKSGISLDVKRYEQEIIADTKLDGESFDDLEGKITPDALARLTIAGNDLQTLFEQTIKNNLGTFRGMKRSVPTVKTAIYSWFKRSLGSENWHEEILLIQKIFVHNGNRVIFESIVSKAIDEYKSVKDKEVREKVAASERFYEFDLPEEQFFNEHTDELISTIAPYAYDKCYLGTDRSEPEQHFEKFLDSNATHISWWWKNGENKQDYFGIRYEYSDGVNTFYPDYIIRFSDGSIGIFEVKHKTDREGQTTTKAKAEALQAWIASQNRKDLFGGIAIEHNGGWLLNSEKSYNWDKCEKGDWGDWEKLPL